MAFKKDLENIFKNSGTNQSKYRFSFKTEQKLAIHNSHGAITNILNLGNSSRTL